MTSNSTPLITPAEFAASPLSAGADRTTDGGTETAQERAERQHREIQNARAVMSTAKLGSNETVVERSRKNEKKLARVQREQAKDQFVVMASLVRTAEAVGFHRCPLGELGLKGALADVLERSLQPGGREEFEAKGRSLSAKNRLAAPDAVRCSVEAAQYSAEFKAEAQRLKLRRDSFRGVYAGRASIAELVRLGTNFLVTVHIKHENRLVALVDAGIVDAVLMAVVAPPLAIESDTAADIVLPSTTPPPNREDAAVDEANALSTRRQAGFGQQVDFSRKFSANPKN
jgi:hypothetical protein